MNAVADRYSRSAIALHWLLASMIAAVFVLGVFMVDLPVTPQRLRLFNWHKWAGIAILVLSALRLVARLTQRPPPLRGYAAKRRRRTASAPSSPVSASHETAPPPPSS